MKQNRVWHAEDGNDAKRAIIREVVESDGPDIGAIYNHYIEHSTATFDEIPLCQESIRRKMEAISHEYPFLVLEDSGGVVGYAHAGSFRPRSAYRFTTEVTIYLSPNMQRRGYGSLLYTALFEEMRKREFRTAIAAITIPNDASVRFHQRHGFRKVAHLKEVGFKFGRWLDVGYWQKMLAPESESREHP